MELDDLAASFQGVRFNGSGFQARCPAHDDRDPLAVCGTPLRIIINVADVDASPTTNHRLEFRQQYLAQMTATPAIDDKFSFDTQLISMTGAGILSAASPPQPAKIPRPAPVAALTSPN